MLLLSNHIRYIINWCYFWRLLLVAEYFDNVVFIREYTFTDAQLNIKNIYKLNCNNSIIIIIIIIIIISV